MPHAPIILGITGASGAIYAVRLLEVLRAAGRDVHLSISASGREVIRQELQLDVDLDNFDANHLRLRKQHTTAFPQQAELEPSAAAEPAPVHYFHHKTSWPPWPAARSSPAAWSSAPAAAPRSARVAAGAAGNLIQRAAEVHLKERRKLILVPRETPLSLAHIDNMRRVTEAGAVVLPASPGWYHGVESLADLVDFVVARICDQLGVEHSLMKRWGTE